MQVDRLLQAKFGDYVPGFRTRLCRPVSATATDQAAA
jgi:hypothetical protein